MRLTLTLIPILCIFFSCRKVCPKPEETCKIELTQGLIAYYPFNGNFNDESGNNHHGVSKNGAMLTADYIGRPEMAAGFDGMNDYILVEGTDKLTPSSITVSMQVMVKNKNRRHAFLNSVNFETAGSQNWGIGQSIDQTNMFDFAVNDNTIDCAAPYIFNPDNLVSSSETITEQRWYNLIVTFGGGKQRIYVDGNLKISKDRNIQNLRECEVADLIIGGYWMNDIISIDGKMDEIRIYDRVLNECEINKLAENFKIAN
jgi:hypothetical protein